VPGCIPFKLFLWEVAGVVRREWCVETTSPLWLYNFIVPPLSLSDFEMVTKNSWTCDLDGANPQSIFLDDINKDLPVPKRTRV
jgi:hypothetical protein